MLRRRRSSAAEPNARQPQSDAAPSSSRSRKGSRRVSLAPNGNAASAEADQSLSRAVDAATSSFKAAEKEGEFAGVRARCVRHYLFSSRVEERIAACISKVLSEPQLRWSPYPSMAPQLRQRPTRCGQDLTRHSREPLGTAAAPRGGACVAHVAAER